MYFKQIFEPNLAQYAYLIGCQRTGEALVIDPMRDVDRYVELAQAEGLRIVAVAETHIHADYLSGAREFADRFGVRLYLSDEGDEDWKYRWAVSGAYDFVPVLHGDTFNVGNIGFTVVHTPGHTPEHICFLVTDHGGGADAPMGIASGDFVFVGDLGRPDLLETAAGQAGARTPAAKALYRSVQQFLELPEYLQLWPGHGAGSACGKALGAVPESTVGYEKRFNGSIQAALRGEDAFVEAILDGQPEPPLYFARMKRDNKNGPPLLGALPQPARLDAAAVQEHVGNLRVALLDVRADRSAFMRSHVPGSLYAPLDNAFPTVAGSYIFPEETIILLVEDEAQVPEAVLNLIRIGLDRVEGYALLADLEGRIEMTATREINTADLEDWRHRPGMAVLDVRRSAEFESRHIEGATNIAHTRLRAHLDTLPTTPTWLVHCRSGRRSAVATAMLERHGYQAVYVDGLFTEWIPRKTATLHA